MSTTEAMKAPNDDKPQIIDKLIEPLNDYLLSSIIRHE